LDDNDYGCYISKTAGVGAIADAVRVNGSLTKLDLGDNSIKGQNQAIIRKAVEGREGFVLEGLF
jgi:hypothetical protein